MNSSSVKPPSSRNVSARIAIAAPLGAGTSRSSVDAVGRLAVAARPGDPAHVHLRAARVQQLRAVEQPQPGHRDADRRILERARRAARARPGATTVSGFRKSSTSPSAPRRRGCSRRANPRFAPGVEDADAFAAPRPPRSRGHRRRCRRRPPRAAVLSGERVEQRPSALARPVGDDDGGGAGQYAPRAARTAGTVLARIEMSSQIDQFSR